MTELDRGAYTPQSDAPLAFDARFSRGSGERPVPITLVVSGVVLVTLVIAMVLFYRSGIRGAGQTPQMVGTPVAQTKAPPASDFAAASSDQAAGLQVYKSEATPPAEMRPATATLAPAPEAPAARPAPKIKPVEEAQLRPAVREAPTQVAAQTVPAAARVIAPTQVAAATVAAAKPAKAAGQPRPAVADIAAGAVVAQIGAFSSQALAQKGWSDVAGLMPGQMAGKSRKVELASRDGKNFYRTFVGGFASKSDASSFCDSLKAAGRDCIVK